MGHVKHGPKYVYDIGELGVHCVVSVRIHTGGETVLEIELRKKEINTIKVTHFYICALDWFKTESS